MDSELIEKWFAYWRPLELGLTPDGHADGLTLTLGVFWARCRGGYNLYRWTGDRSCALPDRIVGAACAGAQQITTFPWTCHASSTVYWYLLRAVGGGGVSESTVHQLRRAEFDADGMLVGPRPNAPVGLTLDYVAGGKIRLRWYYDPTDQEVSPGSFEVYSNIGTGGPVNYDLPLASVDFSAGVTTYEWTSPTLFAWLHLWGAVRAKSADGILEDNTVSVGAEVDSTGPAVHTRVEGTRTDDSP